MKDRDEKKKDFEELRKALEAANNIFVNGFEKMTVDQDYNLRKTVRGAGGQYKVVKNNIAEIASEGLPAADVLKGLRGMTALALTTGDPVALAKALRRMQRRTRLLPLRRAWWKGAPWTSRRLTISPRCRRKSRSLPSCCS